MAIRQLLGNGGRAWAIAPALFTISLVALVLDPLRPGNQFPGWWQIGATVLTAVCVAFAFLVSPNGKIRFGFVGYVVVLLWLTDMLSKRWFDCGPPWFGRPVCERAFHITVVLTVGLVLGAILLIVWSAIRANLRRTGPVDPR